MKPMVTATLRRSLVISTFLCFTIGAVGFKPTSVCPYKFKYLQTTPFGRGFQKAVWLVKQFSPPGARSVRMPEIVVVKRAPDVGMVTESGPDTSTPSGALKKRFANAFQQELRRLMEFEHNTWTMKLYGWCSKAGGDSFYVVEPLAPLAPVLWSPLKWCVRIEMAVQLIDFLSDLHAKRIMHCDLKPDQFGITPEGTIRLVDLDTMQRYKTASSLLPTQRCTPGAEMVCCGMGCMKHSQPQLDCQCPPDGMCKGVSSATTLLRVVCSMIFKDLLFKTDRHETGAPGSLRADTDAWVSRCAAPNSTITVNDAMEHFGSVLMHEDVRSCVAEHTNETQSWVRKAFERRLSEAQVRCTRRYC
eukprot:m.1017873 g.1017873  ORF g.1017873 m.1017873 type:complete len:359 (-) comp24085_c0_seq3:4371-5447(-)